MNANEIISLAKSVGRLLRERFGDEQMSRVVGRGHGGDMTRQIDQMAEEMIIERARQIGDIEILTEETGMRSFGTPRYRWVVDPLDGTTNFTRGIPNFAVSILLQHASSREPIAGVIYDPMRDQLYVAELGKGANMNGRRLKTNSERTLEERVFYLDMHFGRNKQRFNEFIRRFQNLGPVFNTYRSLGSATLAFAFTAAGRLDGFLDLSGNSRYLDVAAGMLILEEAGGRVTDTAGNRISEQYDSLVACASLALNEKMRELLRA